MVGQWNASQAHFWAKMVVGTGGLDHGSCQFVMDGHCFSTNQELA